MDGVEAVITAAGYELSMLLLSDEEARDRVIHDPVGFTKRCDGVVLLDLDPDGPVGTSTMPVVVVGRRSPVFDSVSIDNVEGGRLAGEHLCKLGHRSIGLIAGSQEEVASPVSRLRTQGVRQAMDAAAVRYDESLVRYGNFSALGGFEAARELLELSDPPTAIFGLSDEMAIGAIRAATDLGLRVPEDLSVVGFDDHELSFAFGLTTIAQDPGALGGAGAQMLLDRLAGYDGAIRSLHEPVTLVERTSTAPRM
jgi:DNA-binding LacI/PurR family transcriptional regulator